MNFVRYLKYNIKKRRYIFWSFFHPDNLLKFKYGLGISDKGNE